MLSKNKIKWIQSLENKKSRQDAGLFIVEGEKMVEEFLLSGFPIELLIATNSWFERNSHLTLSANLNREAVTPEEMKKCSQQKTPQQVLCLAKIPASEASSISFQGKLTLLLDTVQDPGNLGTIIRIADWFGIDQIICTKDTADAYNPKVVQSTMGAIMRVPIHYITFESFLKSLHEQGVRIFGTTLDGENIYSTCLPESGCIMMGNESRGIRQEYIYYLDKKLLIPCTSTHQQKSESLNVAVATGIVCAEFRRQNGSFK